MTAAWYQRLYEYYPDYDREPWTCNTVAEVDFFEGPFRHDHNLHVLDVDCGTGRHSLELSRCGYHVTGFDLSTHLLEQARDKAHKMKLEVEFIQGDARAMPLPTLFDAVILLCQGGFSLMDTKEKFSCSIEPVR